MSQDQDSANEETSPGGDFVQLFTKNQRRLYLYILAQVPSPVEAEEILQEANIVVWRKFDRFELGTNFFAWSCRIANYEVLKFRDRRRRDRLRFSNEFIELVAKEIQDSPPDLLGRRSALQGCLAKLRPKDRELIRQRYGSGESGESLAAFLDRPVNSIYQSLGRIRKSLLECMKRRMAAEAGQ